MRKYCSVLFFFSFLIACTPAKYKGLQEGLYAEIQTNKGDILLELFAEKTPMTVANFVSLAEGTNPRVVDSLRGENYFDGLTFHRVVNNFIIQGGDPTATGKGSPGYQFADEFPRNEEGDLILKHDAAGVLSMANPGVDANGSQFFITHRATPHLDGKHSVFGKTVLNSTQRKKLKETVKDSMDLLKAIDSARMVVVNKIQQKDTILAVKIVRIGSAARSFDEALIFEEEFVKFAESRKDRVKQEKLAEEIRYSKYLEDKEKFMSEMGVSKALKTDSGLQILKLKTNPKGQKVVDNKLIKSHFTLYTADGKMIQSTVDSEQPFVFQLDDAQKQMITGFKEGVRTMREGEKARLFIPYYIGFGEAKYGPFPAKSDLVFEVEILKIGQ